MKKTIVLITLLTLAACTTGCTAPRDDVERVLTDQGYTDISVGGHDFFGCSKDDTTANKFTAKGPTGRPVKGVVCGSWSFWGKGYTVRTY